MTTNRPQEDHRISVSGRGFAIENPEERTREYNITVTLTPEQYALLRSFGYVYAEKALISESIKAV